MTAAADPHARAAAFVAANDRHPVVSGTRIEMDPNKPAKGVVYYLANNQRWELSVEASRALPAGYPKWRFG